MKKRRLPIRVGDVVYFRRKVKLLGHLTAQGITQESRFLVLEKPNPRGWVVANPSTSLAYLGRLGIPLKLTQRLLLKDPFLTQVYRAARRDLIHPVTHSSEKENPCLQTPPG